MPRRTGRSADPFFDKPYEPDPAADPAWDHKSAAAPAAGASAASASPLSRFIKPKRKVAALLGGAGGAKSS